MNGDNCLSPRIGTRKPVNADLVNHSIKTDRHVLLVDSDYERAKRLNCIDDSIYSWGHCGSVYFWGRIVLHEPTLGM